MKHMLATAAVPARLANPATAHSLLSGDIIWMPYYLLPASVAQ